MELKTLQNLRLVIPGVICVLYAAILGLMTGLFKLDVPDLEKAFYSLSVLIPGAIYYVTPLRSWINRGHHQRVNENIRSRMVAMAGIVDDKVKYSWKKIRTIFYDIVDNDNSLTVKSKRVMFNGLLWTSAADITALAILFLGYSLILYLSQIPRSADAGCVFFGFALAGFIGSIKLTEKHIRIGDEQLDLMEEKYSADLQTRIAKING